MGNDASGLIARMIPSVMSSKDFFKDIFIGLSGCPNYLRIAVEH